MQDAAKEGCVGLSTSGPSSDEDQYHDTADPYEDARQLMRDHLSTSKVRASETATESNEKAERDTVVEDHTALSEESSVLVEAPAVETGPDAWTDESAGPMVVLTAAIVLAESTAVVESAVLAESKAMTVLATLTVSTAVKEWSATSEPTSATGSDVWPESTAMTEPVVRRLETMCNDEAQGQCRQVEE